MLWKYAANLQENTHSEVWFQWAPLDGCFCRCFKHGIFTITWKVTYMDKSVLRMLEFVTRTRIHYTLFAGITSFPKTSRNCLCWRHFFTRLLFHKTFSHSLPSRTLLNSVIDGFMRVFWNSCTKKVRKYPEKLMFWNSL